MAVEYLELADFFLIAEAVTGVAAEQLATSARTMHLAGSALAAPAASYAGEEFYPDVATKAAILCSRLVRNHPLVDGNKRVAFLCMVEFLERNRKPLRLAGKRQEDSLVDAIVGLATGQTSEADFARLIADRLE